MTTSTQILVQLDNFRRKDKFTDAEWSNRGLIPSNTDLSLKMETLLNQCADSIIDLVKKNASDKLLKRELIKGLSRFNKLDYDTEEKEFICTYFDDLSKILDIKISSNLNAFMYGWLLVLIMKIHNVFSNPDTVIETLSQNCTKCSSKLETFILKRQQDIPDRAFEIVKCKTCGEFNMLDKGPGIKMEKHSNYDLIEYLSKDDFTLEQAQTRLEQIKFFRK
jgi:hypothetical protein